MPDTVTAPVLLHAAEMSQLSGVPVSRLYQLARDGLLPHVRLGRSVRFDRDAVLGFLRNGGRAFPGGWRRQPKPQAQVA